MDGIPGIGPKTTKKLLEHFGSVARIKAQNPGALEAVIGKAKAKVLRRELRRKDKEEDDLRAGNIG